MQQRTDVHLLDALVLSCDCRMSSAAGIKLYQACMHNLKYFMSHCFKALMSTLSLRQMIPVFSAAFCVILSSQPSILTLSSSPGEASKAHQTESTVLTLRRLRSQHATEKYMTYGSACEVVSFLFRWHNYAAFRPLLLVLHMRFGPSWGLPAGGPSACDKGVSSV